MLEDLLLKTQDELKKYLINAMTSYGYDVTSRDGYLKCEYPEGHSSFLIAHLDTYNKVIPQSVKNEGNGIVGYDANENRCILGGDDRCGVYIILKLIDNGFRPQVLFTEDEEIGCVGANAFVNNKDKYKIKLEFCIQIDRGIRGNPDNYVDYNVSTDSFNGIIERLGFEKMIGSSSDVRHIAPYLNIPGVNVCAGYDKEHSRDENIQMGVVECTIEKLSILLNREN